MITTVNADLPGPTLVVKHKGPVVVMTKDVEVVRVGLDPFGRGDPTVFYRDYSVDGGKEVFYMWVEHWNNSTPGRQTRLPPKEEWQLSPEVV